MDTFLADLKKKLIEVSGKSSPWGDVNPLVVIGLTEAILDLGISNEKLHASVRSFARQLAAQIHPDRVDNGVSAERQRQIIEAFKFIESLDNFSLALEDFKRLKAEDRREVRILQQSLSSLRRQVFGFEEQHQKFLIDRNAFVLERQEFDRLKAMEELLVPKLENKIEVLRKEVSRHESYIKELSGSNIDWKSKFEQMATYFAELAQLGQYVQAFNAKWVAIASIWRTGDEEQMLVDRKNRPSETFKEAVKKLAISSDDQRMIISELKMARSQFKNQYSNDPNYRLGLTMVSLDSGRVKNFWGDSAVAYGGRVVGSVSPFKANIREFNLYKGLLQEEATQSITPFLIPGGLMVSMTTDEHKKAKWSLNCPFFRFSLKKLILVAR